MDSHTPRQVSRGSGDEDVRERQRFVVESGASIDWIAKDPYPADAVKNNIENYIGTAKVPVGLAGPLLIHGDHADGEFYVPLATTEGSLVASYNRGMRVIGESGGCRVKVFEDHMERAPVFRFTSLDAAEDFTRWLARQPGRHGERRRKTTSHGRLSDVDVFNLGRNVYVRFGLYHRGRRGAEHGQPGHQPDLQGHPGSVPALGRSASRSTWPRSSAPTRSTPR